MSEEDVLEQLMKLDAWERSEEGGEDLEKRFGYGSWTGETLVNRKEELRPVWDTFITYGVAGFTDEMKVQLDDYVHVSQYLRSPQGKRKIMQYTLQLKKMVNEFKPLPEWEGKRVRVVKEFEETRTHCPAIGTEGVVKHQSLTAKIGEEPYVLIWASFVFPFRTSEDEYFVSYDEYEKLQPEDFDRIMSEFKVSGIWSGREDEDAYTVAFRTDELEIVE
jgi:hypothetical protein